MNRIPDIIIAIDGYSSTGKSTFAKMVAAEYGFLYLDSGAMYRGVTLAGLEAGTIRDGKIDQARTLEVMGPLQLNFRQEEGATRLYLGDRCIEKEIRGWEVSQYVSPVSAIAQVRAWVDERLHAFAAGGRVIMDGRDIGTTVFPDAQLKNYRDSHRETSPLRQAADAYVLDNTHMTLHEELVWVMGLLQGKFAILESPGLSC